MINRHVIVAIPARNEAQRIGACVTSLLKVRRDARVTSFNVLVFANNCSDHTADVARQLCNDGVELNVEERLLPSAKANAGWARRYAFDAAASILKSPNDVLLGTDADTRVDQDWLIRTLDYLDDGYDAVAGWAKLDPREVKTLPPRHRRRLSAIRRYDDALTYIRALTSPSEPWPRHYYEGGASIALTLEAYQDIGGAPTPPVGEDKALFERLQHRGWTVRHAKDVRVLTSCRLRGRASGGVADALAAWGLQGEDDPIYGLSSIEAATTGAEAAPINFSALPEEIIKARELVGRLRRLSKKAMAD